MTRLTNCTPFQVKLIPIFDAHARQLMSVVVSASFQGVGGSQLSISDEQMPVRDNDEHHGEPGFSSVKYEGEIAWHKPCIDVVLNAAAYAPPGRMANTVMVSLRVADIHKELRVSGDRNWRPGPVGRVPGSIKPFDRMPIVYERAFGGTESQGKGRAELRNLVGVGFHGTTSLSPEVATELPNVEYPNESLSSMTDLIRPAGLAVLARSWQPRHAFSGTFDAAWKADQAPLVPLDFDTRHFQVAPADQQSTQIVGGEQVDLINMTPDGAWSFALPRLTFPIRFRYANRIALAPFRLDTVVIEPDERRVVMIGRTAVAAVRNQAPLEEIVVGDVTPGWLRARQMRKPYWGAHAATGGGGPKGNYSL